MNTIEIILLELIFGLIFTLFFLIFYLQDKFKYQISKLEARINHFEELQLLREIEL